jgi:anion-transporting  ArsA/GET3 family ATPase
MEIFGGFMVMMSILGLFLAVVWLIMPFVVLAMKGKQDRSLEVLDTLDKRLAAIEELLKGLQSKQEPPVVVPASLPDAVLPAQN